MVKDKDTDFLRELIQISTAFSFPFPLCFPFSFPYPFPFPFLALFDKAHLVNLSLKLNGPDRREKRKYKRNVRSSLAVKRFLTKSLKV